eukprot:5352788-Lingulodinium_polyedra.AAC.1
MVNNVAACCSRQQALAVRPHPQPRGARVLFAARQAAAMSSLQQLRGALSDDVADEQRLLIPRLEVRQAEREVVRAQL